MNDRAPASVSPATAPAPRRARIRALDVLRGVGVLGMLAVHIQLFAFPTVARWNPNAWGEFIGIHWWAWLVTSVLADGKFISIFAMLFGAGLVMLPGGRERSAVPAWQAHLVRTAALLVLGLLHAYLIWFGDMLVPLALSGAVVFLARGLAPRRLLVLGATTFAVGSIVTLVQMWSLISGPAAALEEWRHENTPRRMRMVDEVNYYQASWADQMEYRVPAAQEIQTWSFVTRLGWQLAGLMLIGMALFKTGVLTAARSDAFYRRLAGWGFGGGGLLIALGLWRSITTDWDALDYVLISQELRTWGNLLVALGWVAVVMLLCRRGRPLRPVAAVGRMALTNYLFQSVVCTTIFYGHGLGLFGEVERAGQLAIVLAVWAVQLLASTAWLAYFTVGPVEWLLRWVVFRRRPAFVR